AAIPAPPTCPYTTLFRSPVPDLLIRIGEVPVVKPSGEAPWVIHLSWALQDVQPSTGELLLYGLRGMVALLGMTVVGVHQRVRVRSEEHTSELQSRFDLVL